ncbi:hypothetical protein JCM10908_007347 [Rhodotorula pacifica]|uniref:Tma64p n=1 Tax=Rhodotorula pacifica TaxID=1495444 RepID=UPI00317A1797
MAFKRPFHAQSRTPVRSSDLRKLRESVSSQFPSLDPDTLKLLTKDMQVCKATTHLDEPCTLYIAPNGDPRFFRLDPQGNDHPLLIPTCYAADLVPPTVPFLPTLGTAHQVVQNLISGSALFAAGVSPRDLAHLAQSSSSSTKVKAGSLVGITVASDPARRIVAIGYLASDPAEIQRLQDEDKGGKAVVTLHARGDFLWQYGSKVDAPLRAEEQAAEEAEEVTERMAATSLSRSASTASSSGSTSQEPLPSAPNRTKGKSASKGKGKSLPTAEDAPNATPSDSSPPAATDLTPSEVDTILLNALLLSISTSPALLKPSTYPLSASALYSSYILPSRPASPPSHASVEIKKSSFKKLDRLIKLAVKRGYLGAKELKKGSGEWIVTGVESRHPEVEKVPRYKTVAAAAAGGESSSSAAAGASNDIASTSVAATTANGSSASSSASGGGGGVEVRELWKLSGDGVKQLFRSVPHERPPHDLYTTADLTSLLRTFTSTHSLPHPSQRSLLLLTPSAHPSPSSLTPQQKEAIDLLARCVCKKGERPEEIGKERGAPGCVGREEAVRRIREGGCTGYWGMKRRGKVAAGGEGEEDEVIKKGSPPTVKVAIKNVGKRQVTLISGHEPWDLFTSEELAEKLKHASASSTSIQPLAGSAKKGQTPKVEIMCQGTHDALVTKLLMTYGVPKTYIEVDLSKSTK